MQYIYSHCRFLEFKNACFIYYMESLEMRWSGIGIICCKMHSFLAWFHACNSALQLGTQSERNYVTFLSRPRIIGFLTLENGR